MAIMNRKSLLRRSINKILLLLARFGPGSTTLRPFLHRLRGVKIYGSVSIGEDVFLEGQYPEAIETHDGAQITLRTTIVAQFRGIGKVIIGKNVWIGANSTIAATPGQLLTVGEGSVLAASCLVTKDVPPSTFMAGVPAKPKAKVTLPLIFGFGKSDRTSYENFENGLKSLKG